MADEHGFFNPGIPQNGPHGFGESIHRGRRLWRVAPAVPGKIEQNEPRPAGQGGHLFAPESDVTPPAVDEDEGGFPLAGSDVMKAVPIDGNKMRLGAGHGGKGGLSHDRVRVVRLGSADQKWNPTEAMMAWLLKLYLPSADWPANCPGVEEGVLPVTVRVGP